MSKILQAVQEQLATLDRVDLGRVGTWWRIFAIHERTHEIRMLAEQHNLIPYQGADVLARLLAGDISYAPAAMFFEFENTAGVPVPPTPVRSEGISYYLTTLPLNPARDYVRSALAVSPAMSASGADYEENQVTFFGMTSGLTGVHGRTFDASVDSKVYGVALAATPVPAQYTSDILFSRSYSGFTPVPKLDGFQIGGQYVIRFR